MAGSRRRLPDSLDDLVELFDTHDMGDFLDQMPEVQAEVSLKSRTHLVAVAEDVVGRIAEIARARHISSEALINSMLREKLAEAS